MADRHRIAVSLSVYLLCFAVALGFFQKGHHLLALAIVFTAWAGLSLWMYFGWPR